MLMNVYSVYDKVTCMYGMPIIEVSDLSLKRSCKTMIMNELMRGNASLDGFISRRSDLSVYSLGHFDNESGMIAVHEPQQVFNVVELIKEVINDMQSGKDEVLSRFKSSLTDDLVKKMKEGVEHESKSDN